MPSGSRRAGQRAGRDAEGNVAGLVGPCVVAADRDGDEIVLVERTAGREDAAQRVAGQESVPFGDEAREACAVGVRVVGQGAADREVPHRYVEQLRERVDVIGSAGEAPGRIGLRRLWRDGGENLEKIAVVGEAVAKSDDLVDPLGRGRRGDGGCGKRGGAKKYAAKQLAVRHGKSSPPRPDGWTAL